MKMDLIFIYGVPAVGKLTVAKEIELLRGFKLFHNHLTVDLVKTLFPWGTKEFSELNRKFRLEMFEAAAKNSVPGMIFTFCFRPGKNDEFVKEVIRIIESNGGRVHFIYLTCDEDEVYRRVLGESRKEHKKITSVQEVKEHIHRWGKISFVNNIEIDNTDLSPKDAAKLILDEILKKEEEQKKIRT